MRMTKIPLLASIGRNQVTVLVMTHLVVTMIENDKVFRRRIFDSKDYL